MWEADKSQSRFTLYRTAAKGCEAQICDALGSGRLSARLNQMEAGGLTVASIAAYYERHVGICEAKQLYLVASDQCAHGTGKAY
jgi:hypothetical protein